MPLARVDRIVVDPHRRAEAGAAIGAAREHHVSPAARASAGYHVDVVVRRAAGAVDCQKDLAGKSPWIHRTAVNQAATHVDGRYLIKRGRDIRVLRVGRANTPKAAAAVPATDVEVPVAGYIECSPLRVVGNKNWCLPGRSTISGAAESTEIASVVVGPKLVLEAVAHAGGCSVEGKPLLIAAVRGAVG